MSTALSKRLQVLFTIDEYAKLKEEAMRRKTTIGELIRKAIRKNYLVNPKKEKIKAAENLIKMKMPVADWEEMEKEIIKGASG